MPEEVLLSNAIAVLIDELSGDTPLVDRLAAAGALGGAARERASLEIRRAVLAALAGSRAEADVAVGRARIAAPPTGAAGVELVAAFVAIEAGHAARAAGAMERAEASLGSAGSAAVGVLAQTLHSQLLVEDAPQAAMDAAQAGVDAAAATPVGGPLSAVASMAAAAAALATGRLDAAKNHLASAQGAEGVQGVLAGRIDALAGQVALASQPPGLEAARLRLGEAIRRFGSLGAPADWGRALLLMADAASKANDPNDVPASWLGMAQPLLAKAGRPRDQLSLRRAFRAYGRREVDRVTDAEVASAMDALRARRHRLRDVVSAQRDARDVGPTRRLPAGRPADTLIDEALRSVHETEDQLIGALERVLVDRERSVQVASASRELAAIDAPGELWQAIPRLSMPVCAAVSSALLDVQPSGATTLVGSAGPPLSSSLAMVRGAATASRADGLPRIADVEGTGRGRCAVVALGEADGRLALAVERAAGAEPLGQREIELLAVYGSIAGISIARARSSAALREAAARDAATLEAIRDGVLTIDAEGVVRGANSAAGQLLGVGRDGLVGRPLSGVPGLTPLAEALAAAPSRPGTPEARSLAGDMVSLPRGDVLVRSRTYEGGVAVTLQELAAAQRLAHRLVSAQARFTFDDLIGRDPVFLACLKDARQVARSDVGILITGESGTGKEMLAQAVHRASPRSALPFVGINVAALPRELLESELFGYERGAFTGAASGGKPGKFELAERGTLLLDEIGDLSLELQAKLLRVLQERVVQRLGGTRDIAIRARVIATTHADLEALVREGAFRLDLYHRLRVVHLHLPPLRERQGDIALLVEHALVGYARRARRGPIRVAPQVLDGLVGHPWPGNIRELANVVEAAASLLPLDRDLIAQEDFRGHGQVASRERVSSVRAAPLAQGGRGSEVQTTKPMVLAGQGSFDQVVLLEEVERRAVEAALGQSGGNVADAAKALGVAKGTLYSKVRRYGLQDRVASSRSRRDHKHG